MAGEYMFPVELTYQDLPFTLRVPATSAATDACPCSNATYVLHIRIAPYWEGSPGKHVRVRAHGGWWAHPYGYGTTPPMGSECAYASAACFVKTITYGTELTIIQYKASGSPAINVEVEVFDGSVSC